MITYKGQEMKILWFMHATYHTIRLDLLVIKQKSVSKNSYNLRGFGQKKRQKTD